MNEMRPIYPSAPEVGTFCITRYLKIIALLSILALGFSGSGHSRAAEITFNGEASAWLGVDGEQELGVRYIPGIGLSRELAGERNIDAEISLNSYAWAPIDSLSDLEDNAEAKLYRSWVRYSAAQYEMRLGLQEINFGPAKILRSLMWFDQLDPRDPLQLTEGVYSLLGRYYFLNNANVWVWGLYGNDDLKGLEMFETDGDQVEFGGRCQYPAGKGEVAFTFHHRQLDTADWEEKTLFPLADGSEDRYALDGIWDIEVGLWFEASLGEIEIDVDRKLRRELLTIGSDYTFETGIYLMVEHLIQSMDSETQELDRTDSISALSLNYRFNIMDSVNTICYYDWDEGEAYFYAGWRRAYDNWKIDLLAFSSREDGLGVFSGNGVQFILTYNH